MRSGLILTTPDGHALKAFSYGTKPGLAGRYFSENRVYRAAKQRKRQLL